MSADWATARPVSAHGGGDWGVGAWEEREPVVVAVGGDALRESR